MKPTTTYLVCATQRSGSFLLCEAVRNTGLGGKPEEYFLEWEDGRWVKEHGVISQDEYLNLILMSGTSENGVFGCKIMWNYFNKTITKLREMTDFNALSSSEILNRLFPNLHYVWMRRRDKVRQAVSWAKAGQTECFAWHRGKSQKYRRQPVFRFDMIDGLLGLINEGEEGWQKFYDNAGITPMQVFYEDLVDTYRETAIEVLKYIGVAIPRKIKWADRILQKQSDKINENWVQQYYEIKNQQEH